MIKKGLLLLFLTFSISVQGQKIMGYLPDYGVPKIDSVQFNKLTDVIFCFIQPNTDGTLIQNFSGTTDFYFYLNYFNQIKEKCQSLDKRLHISTGGADPGDDRAIRLNDVSGDPTKRATFVSELVAFAIKHNLAGINVDWEFPKNTTEKNNHQNLVSDLKTAIQNSKRPDLVLSICVGGEYSGNPDHLDYINSTTLTYADEVHLMLYDFSSSYDWFNHSTYSNMTSSMTAWNSAPMNLPYNKMVIALPFYAKPQNRASTNAYNSIATSNTIAAAMYTSDSYTSGSVTYYYNGKTTLENKIDYIINQNCLGIAIWEVTSDRKANYSLLTACYDKMQSKCTVPAPSCGSDAAICSGSVSLNSNVATSGGRTFQWYKNKTSIGGATSNTYSATSPGFYKVIVTEGNCKRFDEIIVRNYSSTSGTPNSISCPGTMNLTGTIGSGTLQWYDATNTGKLIGTGTSISTTINSSGNVYVQPKLDTTILTGTTYTSVASLWSETPRFATKIDVYQTLTIKSVKTFGNGTVNATFKIYKSDATTLEVSGTAQSVTYGGHGDFRTYNVNLTLHPGTYYFVAEGTGNMYLNPLTNISDFTLNNVIKIYGKCYTKSGSSYSTASNYYGSYYDWEITTDHVPLCGRNSVAVTISNSLNTSIAVSSTTPICSGNNGTVTIQNSESGVSYQSYINAVAVGSAGSGTGSDLNISIPSGNLSTGTNTITFKATKSPCSAVDLTNSTSIVVNTVPAQPSTISGSTTPIKGTSVLYSVTNVSGVTYNWIYDGPNTTTNGVTTNSQTLTFASNASSGTLTATPSNSCGNGTARTLSITPQNPTDVDDILHFAKSINIYPNPNQTDRSGYLLIESNNNELLSIDIVDVTGKQCANMGQVFINHGINEITLPELKSGIHYIRLKTDNKVKTIKYMIQ